MFSGCLHYFSKQCWKFWDSAKKNLINILVWGAVPLKRHNASEKIRNSLIFVKSWDICEAKLKTKQKKKKKPHTHTPLLVKRVNWDICTNTPIQTGTFECGYTPAFWVYTKYECDYTPITWGYPNAPSIWDMLLNAFIWHFRSHAGNAQMGTSPVGSVFTFPLAESDVCPRFTPLQTHTHTHPPTPATPTHPQRPSHTHTHPPRVRGICN